MGGNFNFTREAVRDFMFTEGGKGTMMFDVSEGGSLERVVGQHLSAANKKGMFGGSPSMAVQLERILSQVRAIPTNKAERDRQILEKGSEDLGTMVQRGHTMCWEKAGLMHMLLTEMGIASQILSGEDKTTKGHHAWVEVLGAPYSIEATAGIIAPSAEYDARFRIYDRKVVARPKFSMHPDEVTELLAGSSHLRTGAISSIAI
jgi:hypothetical protein